jgi:hypothetical protein
MPLTDAPALFLTPTPFSTNPLSPSSAGSAKTPPVPRPGSRIPPSPAAVAPPQQDSERAAVHIGSIMPA